MPKKAGSRKHDELSQWLKSWVLPGIKSLRSRATPSFFYAIAFSNAPQPFFSGGGDANHQILFFWRIKMFDTLRTKIADLQKRIFDGLGSDADLRELVELELAEAEQAAKEAAKEAAIQAKRAQIEKAMTEKKRLRALAEAEAEMAKVQARAAALDKKKAAVLKALNEWADEVTEVNTAARTAFNGARPHVMSNEIAREDRVHGLYLTVGKTTVTIPHVTSVVGEMVQALKAKGFDINPRLLGVLNLVE
jgi:hypothetical protein